MCYKDVKKTNYDESIIGARIQVYWDRDYKWYTGYVTAFTPNGEGVDKELAGKHTVTYDDGDTKHYCLAKKKFRLMPEVGIRLACNQVHRL